METITKKIESKYSAETGLFETSLSGLISTEDVQEWQNSINAVLAQIPDHSNFKALINIHGYEPQDVEAHKAFRTVIPLTMAKYSFRVGYIDMFEEADLPLSGIRDIACIAFANVHQDEVKMKKYQDNYAKSNELYTTDIKEAYKWLERF